MKLDLVGRGPGKLKAMVETDTDMEITRVMDMGKDTMEVVPPDDL
jgi:hypothetical protein